MKGTYIDKISKVFNKLLLILLIIIFSLNIIITSAIIISYNKNKQKNSANNYTSQINSFLLEVETRLNSIEGGFESSALIDYNGKLDFLDSIAKQSDLISATYFVDAKTKQVIMNNGWTPPDDFDVTTREWYKKSIDSNDSYISDPYFDEQSGSLCITLAKKVVKDNKTIGVVGIDMYMNNIVDIISQSFNDNDYTFLTTSDGTILVHPDSSLMLSKDIKETLDTALNGKYKSLMNSDYKFIADYKGGIKSMTKTSPDLATWNIITVQSILPIIISIFLIVILNIVLFILSIYFSKKYISKQMIVWFSPLISISKKVNKISEGDLDVIFDENQITEEIELLTNSLNNTVKMLKHYIDNISSVIKTISDNDLSICIDSDYKGEFIKIKDSLNTILEKLNTSFKNINNHAYDVSVYSEKVKNSTQNVTNNAIEESRTISNFANDINTLAEKVEIINKSAQNASNTSTQTNAELEAENEKMNSLLKAMDGITNSSNEITKIVSTINDLAEETNLLALNASIESARAGEAGKGFSVVAEEISKLASESSLASSNIAELIQKSNIEVEKGRNLTVSTASSLKQGIENSLKAQEELNDITKFVQEQHISINKIKNEIHNISKIVSDNASYSKDNLNESDKLINKSIELKNTINEFKLKN